MHRMKDGWNAVREQGESRTWREQDMVAAYADQRRADYQFREWQDVLINRRRHYRGQFGSDQWLLVPRAVGHFRIKREIPIAIRGKAVPVFHSRDPKKR